MTAATRWRPQPRRSGGIVGGVLAALLFIPLLCGPAAAVERIEAPTADEIEALLRRALVDRGEAASVHLRDSGPARLLQFKLLHIEQVSATRWDAMALLLFERPPPSPHMLLFERRHAGLYGLVLRRQHGDWILQRWTPRAVVRPLPRQT